MLRATLVLALAYTLLLATATPARAELQSWLVWDRTTSLEPGPRNFNFTGPTTIRAAVVARGLSGPVKAHSVIAYVYTWEVDFPDAWRFEDGGCQSGRVAIRVAPDSPDVPGLRYPGGVSIRGVSYDAHSRSLRIVAAAAGEAAAAVLTDPETTYVLAEFDFDLREAVAGSTPGPKCGCAEQQIAIRLPQLELLDGSGEILTDAGFCYGINDPYGDDCSNRECGNPYPCMPDPSTCGVAVSSPQASWGRVKAGYR